MGYGGERFSQTVCCHINCRDVFELQSTESYLLLDPVIVDVNMLSTLVESFLLSELDGWQVVDVELQRLK